MAIGFFYVGSPNGLPLFDRLRSIFLFMLTHINIMTIFVDGIDVDIHSKQVDLNLLLLLLLFSCLLFAIDPISKRKTMMELGIAKI